MKRLLALRAIEEEQAEAELMKQRRLMQMCLDALEASATRKRMGLCALHQALEVGDRNGALSAEMALVCSPLNDQLLQCRLTQFEQEVETATLAWKNSRMRRLQIKRLTETQEARLRDDIRTREQKALDAWFQSAEHIRQKDENFPRELQSSIENDGTERAMNGEE